MSGRSTFLSGLALALVATTAAVPAAPASAAPAGPAAAETAASAPAPRRPAATPGLPDRVTEPERRLGRDWRRSTDRVVTISGDATGLRVLVADGKDAYRWRTAATLSEPYFPTDQWIGQSCVTGSGRRAVVVYAPRQFANREQLSNQAAFAAVVDLTTGAVTKLAERVSLAYHNPGCGAGETAVLSRLEAGPTTARTWLGLVDAAKGTLRPVARPVGQLTSALPVGAGIVAAEGATLVELTRRGAVTRRVDTGGAPFRLTADGRDGVAFQTISGTDANFARLRKGGVTAVGRAPAGTVKLRPGAGGRVYAVGGRAAARLPRVPAGWDTVDAAPDSDVSTTGGLVVTRASTGTEPLAAGAAQAAPVEGSAPVVISARLADSSPVQFSVPVDGSAAGRQLSPAAGGGRATQQRGAVAAAPGDAPTTDGNRSCSVPRNDPKLQVYQPTREQVEWAANLAVRNQLLFQRPANWANNGLPSFTPQGPDMFPAQTLNGGGFVPAQVLLGILGQESNLYQASWHAVDAEAGNPLTSAGFYGLDLANPNPARVDWTKTDCGYGVGQVTTGMRTAETNTYVNGVYMDYFKQKAVALDYATNIAAGLRLLQDKWNTTRAAGLVANNGDPQYIENWWFAIWAYNTGFYAPNGSNPWGVGWANNPANPNFPADRQMFLTAPLDVPSKGIDDQIGYDNAKHPNHWSYPERVIGFAYTSLRRYDYQTRTYAPTYMPALAASRTEAQPNRFTFCVRAANSCDPATSQVPGEHPTEPAGPCTLASLKCWWHTPVTWTNCAQTCGKEQRRYTSVEPRPYATSIYSPQCTTAGLPSGARVIDDIDSAAPLGSNGCARNWTNGGTFAMDFASRTTPNGTTFEPGKVDLHQIGNGFGGHFWFSHTYADSASPQLVTGRWSPSSRFSGWVRVMVHVPDHGAHTQQARYVINTGLEQRIRYVPTRLERNAWVTLGVYQFGGSGPQNVELSNYTPDGTGDEDVAWDALAFVPQAKPSQFVVAMGDSYGSGEGAGSYTYETDNMFGSRSWNACRRSNEAWPRKLVLPGQSSSVASRVAANDASLDFQFVSCSGALADRMNDTAPRTYWRYPPSDYNQFWPTANGQYREISQIQSGALSRDTSLVLLSAGGNDARFSDTVQGCYQPNCATPAHEETGRANIASAKARVASLIASIHQRAQNAKIVLVGYPKLFADSVAVSCGPFGLFANEEMAMLNRLALVMRDAQADVVAQARAAGINAHFVDMTTGFRDRGTCRGVDPNDPDANSRPEEIHGVVFGPVGPGDFQVLPNLDPGQICPIKLLDGAFEKCVSRSSFHPKAGGTTLYARAVEAQL